MDNNTNNELLWLVFKIGDQLYAINSGFVTSIVTMPEKITSVPFTPKLIRGIFNLMGKIVPSIEMRLLLNMKTQSEEKAELVNMLDQRKKDHILWVKELFKSIDNNTPFTLQNDPALCKFGVWVNSFNEEEHSFTYSLSKIVEPHSELHHLADKLDDIRDNPYKAERVKTKAENYMNTILSLIDSAKVEYAESQKELCIIVNYEEKTSGLICDDVVMVGKIEMIEKTKQNKLNENISWIKDLAVTSEKQPIFVIDTHEFFQSYDTPVKTIPQL